MLHQPERTVSSTASASSLSITMSESGTRQRDSLIEPDLGPMDAVT